MNTYIAKDQKEFDIIVKKILAKDRGAYIGFSSVKPFPKPIETNVKIKH